MTPIRGHFQILHAFARVCHTSENDPFSEKGIIFRLYRAADFQETRDFMLVASLPFVPAGDIVGMQKLHITPPEHNHVRDMNLAFEVLSLRLRSVDRCVPPLP